MHAPSASDLCDAQDGTIVGNARFLLQHVLATPTVNFISSPDRSNRAFPGSGTVIRLPLPFFVNSQALSLVDIAASGAFPVPYAQYRQTLKECVHSGLKSPEPYMASAARTLLCAGGPTLPLAGTPIWN